MFGPGDYVADETQGITRVEDLPDLLADDRVDGGGVADVGVREGDEVHPPGAVELRAGASGREERQRKEEGPNSHPAVARQPPARRGSRRERSHQKAIPTESCWFPPKVPSNFE